MSRDKKEEAAALAQLRRMSDGQWTCSSCEQIHSGLFDLAFFCPAAWTEEEAYEPNANVRFDGNFLSEDFCVINGENFIIRCVLTIPIHGLDQRLGFGVWSTLSRANFEAYLEEFDDGHQGKGVEWTGWFMNRIKEFGETYAKPCWVYPQKDRQRPHIFIADEECELGRAQRDGISAKRALGVFRAYGHSA
jgi:hypothetical protein